MIDLEKVTKTFGSRCVISSLTLSVSAGSTVGFVGANGAGKTTTIRLMLGFLRPSSGSVRLLEQDMAQAQRARAVRAKIGYAPDEAGLDPVLSGRRLLDDLAALQTVPPVDREELVDKLELSSRDLARPIGRLSRGTRQKLNIVQALQHRPELIILDEPTEGLDPFAKQALVRLLQQAKSRGATVFFSSHILSELEDVCDKVALIRQGRLLRVFDLQSVAKEMGHSVKLQIDEERKNAPEVALLLEHLNQAAWTTAYTQTGCTVVFITKDLSHLFRLLVHLPVSELTVSPLTLEDLVTPYYEPD